MSETFIHHRSRRIVLFYARSIVARCDRRRPGTRRNARCDDRGKVQNGILDEGIHSPRSIATSVKTLRVQVQKTDLKADAAIKRFAKIYCVIRNQLGH